MQRPGCWWCAPATGTGEHGQRAFAHHSLAAQEGEEFHADLPTRAGHKVAGLLVRHLHACVGAGAHVATCEWRWRRRRGERSSAVRVLRPADIKIMGQAVQLPSRGMTNRRGCCWSQHSSCQQGVSLPPASAVSLPPSATHHTVGSLPLRWCSPCASRHRCAAPSAPPAARPAAAAAPMVPGCCCRAPAAHWMQLQAACAVWNARWRRQLAPAARKLSAGSAGSSVGEGVDDL